VARVAGARVEDAFPGRQGRLAFAYLACNRARVVARDELAAALWEEPPPTDALSPLLSKLRRVLPLDGRGDVRLVLPDGAFVDVEAAAEALHRAQAAAARQDWAAAWGPARVTQHVTARTFLPGEDAPWVEERRRELEELHLRALELAGRASLEIGGAELDTAERTAQALMRRSPYRESGYRLLMETLAARGDAAEALVVYDGLRRRLRDDLGAAPSALTQSVHRRLLG